MIKEKFTILKEYMKAGISPLLIEEIPSEMLESAIVLEADCDVSLLNGRYEGIEFVAPVWYEELKQLCIEKHGILVIQNIQKIPVQEQTKFIELFKYKKISTFDLPKNCTILVTSSSKEYPIAEEVYTLMAHI